MLIMQDKLIIYNESVAISKKIDKLQLKFNTHTASVHLTVDQSYVRLLRIADSKLKLDSLAEADQVDKVGNDGKVIPLRSVELRSSSKLNSFTTSEIGNLKKFLLQLSKYNDQQLYSYIEPSLSVPEQKLLLAGNLKQVKGVRFQIGAALRMLDDVINNNKFGSRYSHPADRAMDCGISLKQMLALSWYSLNDEANLVLGRLDRDKPDYLQAKIRRELFYIRHLYEIRREYNINHGDES